MISVGSGTISGIPGFNPISLVELFRWLGGNRAAPTAGSYPGFNSQGEDVLQEIIDKYQYADYTVEDPTALAASLGIPVGSLSEFLNFTKNPGSAPAPSAPYRVRTLDRS